MIMATMPSRRQSLRIPPRLCARIILIIAALLYSSSLSLVIRNHTTQQVIDHPLHPQHSQPHRDLNDDESIAHFISKKWNLTTHHGPTLLAQQFTRSNDYNPSTDFLHFHHIAKTGGTSISDILKAIFGNAVMPGSERSNFFKEEEFHSAILQRAQDLKRSGKAVGTFPEFKVSYSHTRLRPVHGPNQTEFSQFFNNYNSLLPKPKRIRSLGMLREPTYLRASTHAMTMCALNGKVNTFNYWREKRNETRVCTLQEGLNVTALVEDYHEKVLKTKCTANSTKLDKFEKKICNKGPSAMSYCLSPSHLLSSGMYNGIRSMYRYLMGRYFANQEMVENYVSIETYMRRHFGNFDIKQIEEYTLVDLGGLDMVTYQQYPMEKYLDGNAAVQNSEMYEPDFVWFGITERMSESTCLLFYTLNVKPMDVPRARVVNCPPISWWTAKDMEEVKQREVGDYAVWRVANAILDVRIEKMQREIRERLKDEGLGADERDRLEAFVESGCLEFKYK